MTKFLCSIRISAIAAIWLLSVSGAQAAETLDSAIDSLARKFVVSINPSVPTKRIAVTPFVASDRRTTQFTDLLMIALTGKMVELGKGKVRVIERAQLETAIAEIQLSDVPIFDQNTAQQLGKFLGVDFLIVGEITPLTDSVRLDARMIDVATIETVDQASETVPLTPTVQRQLDALAVMSKPSVGGSGQMDVHDGVWSGTGECNGTQIGLAVSLIVQSDLTVSAMQTYFPVEQNTSRDSLQSGTLLMEGTIDVATNSIKLEPGDWLNRPKGHEALGFSGTFDANDEVLSGKYSREGCGAIRLKKMK